jgi:hypothetical protein
LVDSPDNQAEGIALEQRKSLIDMLELHWHLDIGQS